MKRVICLVLVLCSSFIYGENWNMFRGPRGDGTSLETDVPVKWSGEENVLWKTPIPGKGHASPIVWEDKVFIVTAIAETEERILMCFNRDSGRPLWQKVVLVSPFEKLHSLNSRASSTPATDGERVYVSFLDKDKMFVAAYDFEGNMVWEVRPGVFSSRHGYCSSPILWKDTVIVNGDHDGPGYIAMLDRRTGRTNRKIERPNNTRSYCVPVIFNIDGRNEMVLAGSLCVTSYDPDTGELIWIIDGPTEQYVASLVYNGKLLFLTCGYPDRYMLGIKTGGAGNITKTHELWRLDRDCSYVPSPIAFGDYFLNVDDTGVASCIVAETGKVLWRERLKDRHSASLTSANGLVYFLSDKGVMHVIKPGDKLEIVARNEIGEETNASPAISDGKMFIRGDKHLYCISK